MDYRTATSLVSVIAVTWVVSLSIVHLLVLSPGPHPSIMIFTWIVMVIDVASFLVIPGTTFLWIGSVYRWSRNRGTESEGECMSDSVRAGIALIALMVAQALASANVLIDPGRN